MSTQTAIEFITHYLCVLINRMEIKKAEHHNRNKQPGRREPAVETIPLLTRLRLHLAKYWLIPRYESGRFSPSFRIQNPPIVLWITPCLEYEPDNKHMQFIAKRLADQLWDKLPPDHFSKLSCVSREEIVEYYRICTQ